MIIFRQYNVTPAKLVGAVLIGGGLLASSLAYIALPLNNDTVILAAETPTKPTNLDLDTNDDTGLNDQDNITNLTDNLTITGCADASSTITYYDNGTNLGTTTTTNTTCSGGGYTFSKDISLSEAVHSITVTATTKHTQHLSLIHI